MPFVYELNRYPLETYRMCESERPVRQGVRKLSYLGRRMRAFSYAWSLPVTRQRWRSHHLPLSKTHMLHANLMALSFIEPELGL